MSRCIDSCLNKALAASDVGIAIGSGSDVAISSASFILLSSNLKSLLTLCDLSQKVFNRVKQNFVSNLKDLSLSRLQFAHAVRAGLGVHVQHYCGTGRRRRDLPRWSRSSCARMGIVGNGPVVSLSHQPTCVDLRVLTCRFPSFLSAPFLSSFLHWRSGCTRNPKCNRLILM